MAAGLLAVAGLLVSAFAAFGGPAIPTTRVVDTSAHAAAASPLGATWTLQKCGQKRKIKLKRGRVRTKTTAPCPKRPQTITLPGPRGPAGPQGAPGTAGSPGRTGDAATSPAAGTSTGFDDPPASFSDSVDILRTTVKTADPGRLLIDARADAVSVSAFDCPAGGGDCHLSFGLYVDGKPVPGSGKVHTLSVAPGASVSPDPAGALGDAAGVTLSVLSDAVAAGEHDVRLALVSDAGTLSGPTVRGSIAAVLVAT